MRRFKKTKPQMLQGLVEDYRRQTGASSVSLKEVAAWAIRHKKWGPQRSSAIKILTKDLAVALREEYFTDPQGRRVRRKHAQRVFREVTEGKHEQLVLWHDITEATRPQMQAAFQQRRHSVVMDCRQLKQDVDSFNENYNNSVSIQMVFDFTEDLEELEQQADDSKE